MTEYTITYEKDTIFCSGYEIFQYKDYPNTVFYSNS